MGANPFVLFAILAWSLVWKGVALWKAARKGDKIWYIVLLLVNLIGILEILYIYIFSERKTKVAEEKK
jgi:methionyl-tRNA synthetase